MPGQADTALVRRLNEVVVERGMTQEEVSERSGIPQSTISRWFAAIEAGEAVPLRPKNRNAIRAFLARAESDHGERAATLGKLIAADILEGIAAQLRREAGGMQHENGHTRAARPAVDSMAEAEALHDEFDRAEEGKRRRRAE